ncbi:MAG: hypothetical protein Q7T71_14315, partial [Herbiconiux sp.]|nr:hypothetical protein [Herbiconiux sp.]
MTAAAPPAPAPGPGARNRAKIDTTLARMEGLFGLIFAVLSLPVLSASVGTLKPEWAWGVSIALFGSIAVACVCSLVDRGVRVSMAVLPLLFLITLLLWPLAVRSPTAALGTQPWLWYIVIVAITAAAISFPTAWAGVYAVGVPVVYAVLRVQPAGGGASLLEAGLDAFYSLVLGMFVVIVITTLRQAASRVDAVQSAAAATYAEAATRHAAEQERTRVDTVIHDRVLSTLLAAARSQTAEERGRAVQMAERALVALQSAEAESDGTARVELARLAARLRDLARTLAADIDFTVEGDIGGRVPARVLEGVYSAAVQAVVNSVQHAAGPDARPGEGGDGIRRSIVLHGWGAGGFSVR